MDPQSLRDRWERLTDEDIAEINGDPVKLINQLQHRYGFERDPAVQDVEEFLGRPLADESFAHPGGNPVAEKPDSDQAAQ